MFTTTNSNSYYNITESLFTSGHDLNETLSGKLLEFLSTYSRDDSIDLHPTPERIAQDAASLYYYGKLVGANFIKFKLLLCQIDPTQVNEFIEYYNYLIENQVTLFLKIRASMDMDASNNLPKMTTNDFFKDLPTEVRMGVLL